MKISSFCKYIDQPIILNKLDKHMPSLLVGAGSLYGIENSFNNKKSFEDKKDKFIKNSIVISSTIGASLLGTRGLKIGNKKIFSGLMERIPLESIQKKQTEAVNKYLKSENPQDKNILDALERAKTKALTLKQTELLLDKLPQNVARKELFNTILPSKKNLKSGEIFSEIKRLSLLGLVPIIGGISGGILADKVVRTNKKSKISDKIKEGTYQYLANIFLCNVGAGSALYISEKMENAKIIKPLTPGKKLAVILAGITATGIIGGSYIANYISKKLINPLFKENDKNKNLYSERKPELADIALHADDIATAGILSGFKWIEPALPFMYFVSGYRAGIGYRNVKQ